MCRRLFQLHPSTAKPQAEEVVSQGVASEPLAQECLGEEQEQTEKTLEDKTQIQAGKDERHTWTDGMTVMDQSLIFVSIIVLKFLTTRIPSYIHACYLALHHSGSSKKERT